MTTETPVLMTEPQVAELTGLKEQTLTNWRSQRKGPPFIRISNRAIRYDRAEVLEWLESKTVRPRELATA